MRDGKAIETHTREIADGLAMFSNGMVNAFVHLDQCIHNVKKDLQKDRKECNEVLGKLHKDLEAIGKRLGLKPK